jgi:predicted permease
MPNFLATLNFSLSVTFPIFVVMALGFWLRRCQLINDNFIDISSKLTFNITLPALLFISVTKTQADSSSNLKLILFGLGVTLIVFLLLEYLSKIVSRQMIWDTSPEFLKETFLV